MKTSTLKLLTNGFTLQTEEAQIEGAEKFVQMVKDDMFYLVKRWALAQSCRHLDLSACFRCKEQADPPLTSLAAANAFGPVQQVLHH